MDKLTLLGLLDDDKEMVLANLARDRSPQAAAVVLEKAVDRVMYRYVERCADESLVEAAQLAMHTVKAAMPLIDAVGDVREWQKHVDTAERRRRPDRLAVVLLFAGALLVLASALGLYFGGGVRLPLALVKALLPLIAGGACLFFAGRRMAAPPKKAAAPERDELRIEYLVDCEKVWHHLRGAMLMADSQLDNLRDAAAARRQAQSDRVSPALSGEEIDLLTNLLELAYAERDDNAREMISGIRFFLHGRQIELVEYTPERSAWFEKLPAQRQGTIRPALASGEKLLKKGLASA